MQNSSESTDSGGKNANQSLGHSTVFEPWPSNIQNWFFRLFLGWFCTTGIEVHGKQKLSPFVKKCAFYSVLNTAFKEIIVLEGHFLFAYIFWCEIRNFKIKH